MPSTIPYTPGEKMEDGTHIVGLRDVRDGHIMLARTDADYVTWWTREDGARFHGHYFPRSEKGAFAAAWADYCSRT